MGSCVRFESGSVFAGYTVVSRLGRGGMATVYLVREEGLDRLVALKVLPEQLVDDQQFGARFEQEARVIGSLDHPHIIPVYRYGITNDVPWMALRYVDGGDFAQRLIARPLALAEGFGILRGVASALDYAHRKSVVHRDIKPQNILLTSEGSAYLADFGVAKLLQASSVSHTLIGGIVGSPAYMAPEQAQGHAIGPHTDIYSLAVICFQWLTGGLPFEADTPHAILLKHVLEPLPTHALGLLAPPVAAALQKGMAKKPEDRYATAGLLVAALEQAMYAPISMTHDGLAALTPSGLRAISGVDRRLDTPTTLSRAIVDPGLRPDPPTAPSRAVVDSGPHHDVPAPPPRSVEPPTAQWTPPVEPPARQLEPPPAWPTTVVETAAARWPPPAEPPGRPPESPAEPPPSPAPPPPLAQAAPVAPPRIIASVSAPPAASVTAPRLEPLLPPVPPAWPPAAPKAPEPAPTPARTGNTAEPISRVSAILNALRSTPEATPADQGFPADEAEDGTWAQLRRPLAFSALGAALLVGAFAIWRLVAPDPATPSEGEPTTVSSAVETPAEPVVDAAQPGDASTRARAVLKRERERAEAMRTGATDGTDVPAEPETPAPPVEPSAAELARIAAEKREAEERDARRIEEQRLATQREAERLAAEARSRSATASTPAVAAAAPRAQPPAAVPAPTTSPPPGVAAAPGLSGSPAPAGSAPRATAAVTVGGFTEKGGGVVTDSRTGYDWRQSDNGSSIDWARAKSYCKKQGAGWRLPNGRELVGIIDGSGAQSTACGNARCRVPPLFDLSGSSFWTTEQRGRTLSMVVYLNTGSAEAIPVDRGSPRALCVRKP